MKNESGQLQAAGDLGSCQEGGSRGNSGEETTAGLFPSSNTSGDMSKDRIFH